MLPRSVKEKLESKIHKINPLLGNGIAVSHMRDVESYIDSAFWSVVPGFPPGLKYHGCRRCTPLEEYREVSRNKNGKCVFDVARSDIYLMEYKFSYNDEPFSKFIYLPTVGQGGTIYLSGSRFVISPILADQVISVGINSVFVRLLKSRLTFNRTSHHFQANGRTENEQVVWGKIHNKKSTTTSGKASAAPKSTLVHYLLCKHGFDEMFSTYLGFVPIVGREEINPDNYPESEWVICESSKLPPKYFRAAYAVTDIRIAVRKKDYTADAINLITGFYYVVDHFPTRVRPEYVNDQKLWMLLMGHVLWPNDEREIKLFKDAEVHIQSLNDYMDGTYSRKLKHIGYESRDVYHLFFHIIHSFNEWMMTSDDRVSTMYDKELSVVPFVCYDIVSNINNLYFALSGAKKKEFTATKIRNLMNAHLRQGMIFKLNREHGEVTTTGTSGDNKALKITNLLVPQSNSSKSNRGKGRVVLSDPTKRLHASIAEVGSAWAVPKSEPDGRSRLNLTLQVGPTGAVLRDPRFAALIDSVQRKIKRQ